MQRRAHAGPSSTHASAVTFRSFRVQHQRLHTPPVGDRRRRDRESGRRVNVTAASTASSNSTCGIPSIIYRRHALFRPCASWRAGVEANSAEWPAVMFPFCVSTCRLGHGAPFTPSQPGPFPRATLGGKGLAPFAPCLTSKLDLISTASAAQLHASCDQPPPLFRLLFITMSVLLGPLASSMPPREHRTTSYRGQRRQRSARPGITAAPLASVQALQLASRPLFHLAIRGIDQTIRLSEPKCCLVASHQLQVDRRRRPFAWKGGSGASAQSGVSGKLHVIARTLPSPDRQGAFELCRLG